MDAIKIENLIKEYEGFNLNIESLNIKKGFITGFIGPNGSGKTTTIKLILNMINKDAGSVSIFGKEYLQDDLSIKSKIGFVGTKSGFFQELKLKDIKKTISRFYENWDDALYNSYIKEFGLNENKKYNQLSTGQQKQFELTMVLSYHPKLIILDEPTMNLDPLIRNRILEILQETIEKDDATVFFSTHITSDLDKIGDYVVFLYDGRVLLTGEKDELIENHCIVKGKSEFFTEDTKKCLVFGKESKYGFEGLARDKKEAMNVFGEEVVYEKPNLEDLLMYYVEAKKFQ
ncbi:MAG: ABC transporter ATP-binding protein [Clostridioides sp.]|jgi:ABC-2 type transport system ATP-binding protein|nr:ABC transporter ATP-binding protein [Clostridioides sp.]